MAFVYPIANEAAAKHVDTKRAVRQENRRVEGRARLNLAQANDTSRITADGYFPAGIETAENDADCFTILHAPNAMALEFGHEPSGAFGPMTKSGQPGRFYGRQKEDTPPEYILTRAAYGGHTIT